MEWTGWGRVCGVVDADELIRAARKKIKEKLTNMTNKKKKVMCNANNVSLTKKKCYIHHSKKVLRIIKRKQAHKESGVPKMKKQRHAKKEKVQ